MELGKLTQEQIICVLESLHSSASDMHEDSSLSYQEALVKAFHDLWTSVEN